MVGVESGNDLRELLVVKTSATVVGIEAFNDLRELAVVQVESRVRPVEALHESRQPITELGTMCRLGKQLVAESLQLVAPVLKPLDLCTRSNSFGD